jgi:regulator of protease activity HflC (stomatin/prohibitin superfamily)
MASAITLKVGPVTVTRTFADDAQVQAVLLQFAQPPEEMSAREKVDYVLDRMVAMVVAQARRARVRELEAEAAATAQSELSLDGEAGALT